MAKSQKERLKRGKKVRQHQKQLQNFKIVAVFITKNEAENIPRLMDSLNGFADRVVIVDTGSTDNTIEVAKAHGAETHSIAWPDSFSDARNKAVELANVASATWIAMFDADEVLEKGRELRWKLQKMSSRIGVVSIYHKTKYGHRFPRNCIWRPGTAKWMYRFHEHLLPREKGIQVIVDHVVHHPDDVGKNHDNDRVLELMRMDTVEHPNENTRKYYYGRQLFYRKDEKCLEYLRDVFEKSPWAAEAAQAAVFAGNFFEWKWEQLKQTPEENKDEFTDQYIEQARELASNFYKMSIAKYPKLRGAYVGVIRTSQSNYDKMVCAATALKIKESTFFDDPPRYYSEEGNQRFMEVIHENQHLIQNGEENASYAEAVS